MSMMIGLLMALITLASQAPASHKMNKVPGYPESYNTSIYSGYLDLKTTERGAHYVFVESIKGSSNDDPLTLWLNGGPGCSSLIGFIQEIGPYIIPEGVNYNMDDNLTLNPESWYKISNLLFIQSPAGVGFSYNTNESFTYNDSTTATDNMNALLDFFALYPQYKNNRFWLAGESYAGKYIPDLAVLIDKYNTNSSSPINLKGIFVGNGVMDFTTFLKTSVQYMIDRAFCDPEIRSYWENSCQTDRESAGCRFFYINFNEGVDQINPRNVYGYCYYNDSFGLQRRPHLTQESILNKIKHNIHESSLSDDGPSCSYYDGMFNYFNLNEVAYKAKFRDQKWNGPCAHNITTYIIDEGGSMKSYSYLLGRIPDKNYQIHLYNGNWDYVVPFTDTVNNIRRLNLQESYLQIPWFTDNQHSGFTQVYPGIIFSTVKGGSHSAAQSKRPQVFNLFQATIEGAQFESAASSDL